DAPPAKGVVYRLVKHSPPKAEDFLTYHELGWQPDRDPCLRCALSVFLKKNEAAHMRKLFRRVKLGDDIASGTLSAEHGVAKLTSGREPTHTSWWTTLEPQARAELVVVVEDLR